MREAPHSIRLRRKNADAKICRMHLSPGSVWLTVLLGLLVALTPLGTDAYLPTLPAIARAFGAPVRAVQPTSTPVFPVIARGQLRGGPLWDRSGRQPVALAGPARVLPPGPALAARYGPQFTPPAPLGGKAAAGEIYE